MSLRYYTRRWLENRVRDLIILPITSQVQWSGNKLSNPAKRLQTIASAVFAVWFHFVIEIVLCAHVNEKIDYKVQSV